jgi:hypothetical protein
MAENPVDDGRQREGRRSFLKKVGVGAAVAWTAPTIVSTKAFAQGTCGITDPGDVGGLYGWWDAADPTTINPPSNPLVNTAVQTWADKSGNGFDLIQNTSGAQPLWLINSGINGLGSVEFDGTSDFLEATIGSLNTLSALTIFYVVRNDTSPNGPVLWGYDASAGNDPDAWQIAGADVTGTLGGTETFTVASNFIAAGTTAGDYTLGSDDIVTITQSTTLTTLNVNQVPTTLGLGFPSSDLTPSAAVGGTIDTLRVGADDLASTAYFDGLIGEIVIYSGVLTASEITSVECYLNLKWQL